jgi:AraC family transcriptional regulator
MRIARKSPVDRSLAYVDRVNRAIDHILQHLDAPLRLEVVARAAGFSPFHFHRIFRALVGESVAEFVKRVRLERALVLLTRKDWPTRRRASLTDIALACGFASSSDFSRCFRQRYGVAPRAFDVESFRLRRRAEWLDAAADPRERLMVQRLPRGTNPDGFTVRLRRLPARHVAYVRVANSFRPGAVAAAAAKFVHWAAQRGLADGQWLGYMWDDPEIVAPERCRYDLAVEVPHPVRADGVGHLQFPPMQVAEVELRGGVDLELRALDWLYRTWLPTSGYVPTEQPAFEAFLGRPFAHGDEYFELRAQLPVARG